MTKIDTGVYLPLRDLVTVVAGPAHVLAEELCSLAGIDFAVVFGSWAARYRGEHGPIPNDIDVLVVGSPDRDDIYDAAHRAQGRLGREVNPIVASFNRWNSDDDPLMRDVRTKPVVTVCGTVPQTGVA
ncbi:MAG: nucleotidyltransferase family protein [Dermatophilaceae bacterium]